MSIANLTRYEGGGPLLFGGESKMYVASNGGYVKFEEAKEASSNSLQQLKDKIAALESKLRMVGCISAEDTEELCSIREEMRQLSAV